MSDITKSDRDKPRLNGCAVGLAVSGKSTFAAAFARLSEIGNGNWSITRNRFDCADVPLYKSR